MATTFPVTVQSQLTTELDDNAVVGGGIQVCVDSGSEGTKSYHLTAGEPISVVVVPGSTIKISLDSQNLDCT